MLPHSFLRLLPFALLSWAGFAAAAPLSGEPVPVSGHFIDKDDETATNMSGIACAPASKGERVCIAIDDQGRFAQKAALDEHGFTVGDEVTLIGKDEPAPIRGASPEDTRCTDNEWRFKDLDGEAVAFAAPYFYVAGSHGCARKSKKFAASSFVLARFKPGAETAVETTYRLADALAVAEHVAPAFAHDLNPDDDGALEGLNVEGIVVADGMLYAGLRAPAIDGDAFIVRVPVEDLFAAGKQRLSSEPDVLPVRLGSGVGIRDLAPLADGSIAILAGPTRENENTPYSLFAVDVRQEKPVARLLAVLEDVWLPSSNGKRERAKAEALLPVENSSSSFIIMFDGLPDGRPTRYTVAAPQARRSSAIVEPNPEVKTAVIIRERPSLNAKPMGSLRPSERAEFAGSVGRWRRVLLPEGGEGFVSRNLTRVTHARSSRHRRAAEVDHYAAGIDQLNATAWMMSSAEYAGNALSIYAAATRQLESIANDDDASTSRRAPVVLEQTDEDLESLPPAVILDLDETVLDNSLHQAEGILRAEPFTDRTWNDWVEREAAGAIPGAADFLKKAHDLGIAIIFISNRSCFKDDDAAQRYYAGGATQASHCQTLEPTVRNLITLFKFDAVEVLTPDAKASARGFTAWIMPRYLLSTWKEKATRRRDASQRYWIAMALGDDLRDFVDPAAYARQKNELLGRWGRSWYVLPNAMYGGWERPLVTGAAKACGPGQQASQACTDARIRAKYDWLKTNSASRKKNP